LNNRAFLVRIIATLPQASFHAGILYREQSKRAFHVFRETRHRQSPENAEGVARYWWSRTRWKRFRAHAAL